MELLLMMIVSLPPEDPRDEATNHSDHSVVVSRLQ